jgi:hypothetical protein
MPRWKLKKDCLFINAYHYEKTLANPQKPFDRTDQSIRHAHIIDKSAKAKTDKGHPYTIFNDAAGFIGNFIVMGVETDELLPQIVVSEFGIDPAKAKLEVDATLAMMKKYLDEIAGPETVRPPLRKESHVGEEDRPPTGFHSGIYELDFRVNPVGTVVTKVGGRI